jgi:hypothetical protein
MRARQPLKILRDLDGQIMQIREAYPDGTTAGVWVRGYPDVWVANFSYKDEFRRRVRDAIAGAAT